MRTLLLIVLLAAPGAAQLPGLPVSGGEPAPTVVEKRLITADSVGVDGWGAFDTFERAYADLTGDGRLEIVAQNDDGRTFVFGADGRLLAVARVPRDMSLALRDLNGVAVGDVDGDGRLDLVIATSTGKVARFEADARPDGLILQPVWTAKLGEMDAPAALADLEGDGTLETFLQADGAAGQHALRSDGKPLWSVAEGDGNAAVVLAHLDGDRNLEAVFATDGGRLIVRDAATGEKRWEARVPAKPGSVAIAPVVLDLDGDGRPEIVVAARNVAQDGGADWIARSHAVVAAYAADGRLRWTFSADWMNPLVGAKPAVHDVDGDGRLDLVYVDWNTPGHKPGNWERLPTANAFALSPDGKLLWRHAFPAYWSNRAPLVLDVTGDGVDEVVLVGDRDGRSQLLLLGLDGTERAWIPLREGWTANRGAEAADLDRDGKLDLVVPMTRPASGCAWPACREGALLVLGTAGRAGQVAPPRIPSGGAGAGAGGGAPGGGAGGETEARLVGQVFAPSGLPVGSARVSVEGRPEVAVTLSDGSFELRLPRAEHTLRIEAFAYVTQTADVDLTGGDQTVRIELSEQAVARAPTPAPAFALVAAAAATVALLRGRRA